jgi:response regulator of citrate/malate metabolism
MNNITKQSLASSTKLERAWYALRRLDNGFGVLARELANELSVSHRTAERYLKALADEKRASREKRQWLAIGWRWKR